MVGSFVQPGKQLLEKTKRLCGHLRDFVLEDLRIPRDLSKISVSDLHYERIRSRLRLAE